MKYEDLIPIEENDQRVIIRYDENGKPNRYTPYIEVVSMSFHNDVLQDTGMGYILWGKKPLIGQEKYKRAKEIYEEKYRKLNLPEQIVEVYNKD